MLDRDSPTRFGLIRHAQTVWNLDKMIQGQKDSALTTTGRAQSRTWGERLAPLSFDRILTSDLGRTVATAELINRALKLPMKKTSRLRELDWGDWTGRRIRDIENEIPEELRIMEQAGWQFCPPGGESRRAVWLRSRERPGRRIQEVAGGNHFDGHPRRCYQVSSLWSGWKKISAPGAGHD